MGFYFLMPWWASLPAITNWYVSYQKIKKGYSLVTYSSLGIDILIYRWVFLYTYGEGFSSWDSTRRFWLASRRSWWPRWLAIGRSAGGGGGGGVVDVYARAGKTGPYFYSVFLLMLRGGGGWGGGVGCWRPLALANHVDVAGVGWGEVVLGFFSAVLVTLLLRFASLKHSQLMEILYIMACVAWRGII